jgi:nitrite reductase/ring-hydroxylating ferredoxin subunit
MTSTTEVDPRKHQAEPYNGYYNRPVLRQDLPLHQVGRGTPGGEYLRRFWHPIMLRQELKDLPKAIQILGEDLVVFRDKSGRVGLLNKFCSHRGTSLEFGIIGENGIRCCYHGWLYDVDGTILETPAEPPSNTIRQRFHHGAYPVRETDEFIFAYMGPPEMMPELPEYDCFTHPPGNKVATFRLDWPCNWLQIQENGSDPIHTAYLHAIVAGQQFSPAFAELPALDFVDTPLGFLSMATRRVKDHVFIRSSDIILPNVAQFGPFHNPGTRDTFLIAAAVTRWVVPIDDQSSFTIGVRHLNKVVDPEGTHHAGEIGIGKAGLIGQTDDRPYEERQLEPGDYDAVISQGLIANHQNEHLATTDRGVAKLRRLVMQGIKAVADGEQPAVPRRYTGRKVPTYSHDIVVRLPSQSNISDVKSLGEFGNRAAKIVVETSDLAPDDRQKAAEERIQRLLADNLVS